MSTWNPNLTIILRLSVLFLCLGLSWQEVQRPFSGPSSGDDSSVVDNGNCPSSPEETSTTMNGAATSPTPAPHDHRGGFLKKMTYDVGLGNEQALVYVDLAEGFEKEPRDPRRLCKMYNLSPLKLHLIRKDDATGTFELINVLDPVSATGVTCEVGHHYIWLDRKNPQAPTHEVWIQKDDDTRHYVYEQPYEMLEDINPTQRERYISFQHGLKYDEFYRHATGGRSYLAASYPPRPPPQHSFWPADYPSQEHLVELDGQNRSLLVYSVSPRILVMGDFLNPIELDMVQALAADLGYTDSDTISASDRRLQRRTSETCWLSCKAHPVLERIYHRATHLLRIPDMTECCAEDLQVVQYKEGQEYRAHYDFKLPGTANEPVRFATLLMYLTDCPKGGETIFPLAAGGALGIQPVAGMAVLFYSVLPDGNIDERAIHASNPVQQGQSTYLT
jgi:prolyl 4-hydroxylase